MTRRPDRLSVTDRVIATCDLRPGPWPAMARTCIWCGGRIPARSTRWCADGCAAEFTRQHKWSAARAAAISRDRHQCVRCGVSADEKKRELAAVKALILTLTATHPMGLARWREGRTAERLYLQPHLLEVNHRTPILGRHHEFGCHHHVDGLETLCHACHVRETAVQFRHRTAGAAIDHQLAMGELL